MKWVWGVVVFVLLLVAGSFASNARSERQEEAEAAASEDRHQQWLAEQREEDFRQEDLLREQERREAQLESDREHLEMWERWLKEDRESRVEGERSVREQYIYENGSDAGYDEMIRRSEWTSGCTVPTRALFCQELAAWVDVVDGDTLRLGDGRLTRMVLIDAPEFYPSTDCFGREARQALRELLSSAGKRALTPYRVIRLDALTPHHGVDPFGRLLRTVTTLASLPDKAEGRLKEVDAGLWLVRNGFVRYEPRWAHQYIAETPEFADQSRTFMRAYSRAEATARSEGLGGWSACNW